MTSGDNVLSESIHVTQARRRVGSGHGKLAVGVVWDAQFVVVLYIDSFSGRRDVVDPAMGAVLLSFEVRRRRSVSNAPSYIQFTMRFARYRWTR